MIFQCNDSHACGAETWTGVIAPVMLTASSCEALIQARGTCFHLIVGDYQNGHYLCIPDLGIGCELSGYADTCWNREQISQYLNDVDTESLVSAIRNIPLMKKEPS